MNELIKVVNYISISVLFLLIYIFIMYLYNIITLYLWKKNINKKGKIVEINDKKIYTIEMGEGNAPVLYISDSGETIFEAECLVKEIFSDRKVVIFDRPGYGWSDKAETIRSAENIVKEIKELVDEIKLNKPFYIMASGAGALYANYYARIYSRDIKGLLLIEPVVIDIIRYEEILNYKAAKELSVNSRIGELEKLKKIVKSQFIIGNRFFKKYLMRKYSGCDKEIYNNILKSKMDVAMYNTALEEANRYMIDENIKKIINSGIFPERDVLIIDYDSKLVEKFYNIKKEKKEFEKFCQEREFILNSIVPIRNKKIVYNSKTLKNIIINDKKMVTEVINEFVK